MIHRQLRLLTQTIKIGLPHPVKYPINDIASMYCSFLNEEPGEGHELFIQPYRNRTNNEDATSRKRSALAHLLAQPTDKDERPCPECQIQCGCKKRSRTCCCGCGPECTNIQTQLSSEPEKFPIESHVAPLVYGLTSLRVVETCWSCQGHETSEGKPLKIPQVWFNSPNATYPELIARHLSNLRCKKNLEYDWEVTINVYSPGEGATTYIIKPDLSTLLDRPELSHLQRDLHTIAYALCFSIRGLAQDELRSINSQPRKSA